MDLKILITVVIFLAACFGTGRADSFNTTEDEEYESEDVKRSHNFFRCSRHSVILARQALMNELDSVNSYGHLWLTDLDKDELLESQKESLSSLIMQESPLIKSNDGQPLFEIDASYFRTAHIRQYRNLTHVAEPTSIKLMRRHGDKCHLTGNKVNYYYTFGLSIGPVEHNLDVVYNLPRDMRLSQPTNWRYGQVSLLVTRLHYEVTIKQAAQYKLNSGCPIEIVDVTYLSVPPAGVTPGSNFFATIGIPNNNQTKPHLQRFFNDYTRPAISNRLRQLLKFQLSGKTLPLTV